MNILVAKVITGLVTAVMIYLITSPLSFASFYIFIKPLLQPYATMHYELISGIPLTAIPPLMLIGTTIIHTALRRDYTFFPPNIVLLYFVLLTAFASFFNSVDLPASISATLKIFSGATLYLLVYNSVNSKEEAKKVLYALTYCSVVPMLFGYYQFATGTGHSWEGKMAHQVGTRIDSLLGEYNTYGIFLCLTIFSSLILLFLETSKVKRRLLIVLIVSMLASSILALNRGSWIGLTASILFSYFFYTKQFKLRWIIATGALITISFSGMIVERINQLDQKEHGRSQNTFSGRIEYWERIYPLIFDHPFTGHGLGTSTIVTEEALNTTTPPHNDYIRLPLEAGIPATIIYVIFLMREFMYRLFLTRRKHDWAVNFPMLAATIYIPIISTTQNVLGSVIVFSMYLALLGVSRKWNRLT